MNVDILNAYRYESYKEKSRFENRKNVILDNKEIKKYACIDLLLEDGSRAEQFIYIQVPEFNPDLIQYFEVDLPSLKFENHVCKYMKSFNFVEGFIEELDDEKNLFITREELKIYCFGKEIDYKIFKARIKQFILERNMQKTMEEYYEEIFDKEYEEWLAGKIICWQHCCMSHTVYSFYTEDNYSHEFIEPTNKMNDKPKEKQFTGPFFSNI